MGPRLRGDDIVFSGALRISGSTKLPNAKCPARDRALKFCGCDGRVYAGTLSGNTASILVFKVAALNGLTM
ncbi:hypothetical protein BH10PSE11_BH10PSE11_26660 [soil metagenome]